MFLIKKLSCDELSFGNHLFNIPVLETWHNYIRVKILRDTTKSWCFTLIFNEPVWFHFMLSLGTMNSSFYTYLLTICELLFWTPEITARKMLTIPTLCNHNIEQAEAHNTDEKGHQDGTSLLQRTWIPRWDRHWPVSAGYQIKGHVRLSARTTFRLGFE